MLDHAKIPWLELALIPRMGPISARRLIEKFGCPENIFKAKFNELISVEGISGSLAEKIIQRQGLCFLDKQLKLIDKYKINVLTPEDDSYPDSLKSIYDKPVVLFTKGNILPDDYFSIAIVGTRLSSFYGRQMSEKVSAQLVQKGMTIVSGGARGIDTYAHQAVLRLSGRTIAVLGCGLDISYPSENRTLFENIRQNGVLVSEFPLGTAPEKGNFPMRNRIISGLSLGVVVIEAPQRSGALITARHALEQGREVFSVPGKAGKFICRGTNQLLREGAKLVEDADDILEELEGVIRHRIDQIKHSQPSEQKYEPVCSDLKLTLDEEKIYNLVSGKSIHIDAIVDRSKLAIGTVFNILTHLELKKLVRQLPGKMFSKI